jgi:TatD DNase family protein
MGFYISLGGYIGYPSSKELRQVIRSLPLDRLLVETDCPFLPPQSRRGQRNEPAYLLETAGYLAEIKVVDLAEAAAATTANAVRLFKLAIKG